MSAKLAIETRALTRTFGRHVAVDRLDLRVPRGTIYGFLGLNGAGKSTTLRMLATLLRPTSGQGLVEGHDVVAEPLEVRRLLGLMGDEGGESQPWWSAREYVRYFAGVRGMRDRRAAAERALDAVGLPPERRPRPIATYSTGMKRRVELARALLGEPRVLLLDEPTRGLDLPAKVQVWELLRERAARDGVTVLVSSHETAEILALCSDLAILAGGRLTYAGTTADLGGGGDAAAFEKRLIQRLAPGP